MHAVRACVLMPEGFLPSANTLQHESEIWQKLTSDLLEFCAKTSLQTSVLINWTLLVLYSYRVRLANDDSLLER